MNEIRVLLADDHPVVRAGIRAFLKEEPDLIVVGEASNAIEAVALTQDLQPDVAVLDICMPGDGVDATRRIRSTCPTTQVLILTFHDQEYYLLLALQAGAAGYVLKSSIDTELLNAIRIVAQGGAFLYPAGTKMLVDEYQAQLATKAHGAEGQLSQRERQVVKLIALGYTASQAAKVLTLSPKTVETYRTRIMQKIGVHSRVALVQYAILHDFLKEDLEG